MLRTKRRQRRKIGQSNGITVTAVTCMLPGHTRTWQETAADMAKANSIVARWKKNPDCGEINVSDGTVWLWLRGKWEEYEEVPW